MGQSTVNGRFEYIAMLVYQRVPANCPPSLGFLGRLDLSSATQLEPQPGNVENSTSHQGHDHRSGQVSLVTPTHTTVAAHS